MPARPSTSLQYRPALDGLRGLAVAGVLVFHLWPHAAPGGWLGVDLFFVLSGYLITTLLVREYVATDRIDLRRFWTARARRLMPALVVVLAFVILGASLWTLPSRRGSVAADVVATVCYVANWRFLTGDEAYFAANGTPSPLRHAWSLAIEEQYYLLFPLLVLVLVRSLHRRRQLALVLAGLAAASAVWMAHLYVPGVDPTRVYYGTDTRAFELLIGAVAGAWIGPAQWGHHRRSPWLPIVEKAAWPALALLVAALLLLDESSTLLFRGGLVMFCLVALVPVLAAASPHPNGFQRALSVAGLRHLGLISYTLYLWHWPLHVFLDPDRLHLDASWSGVVQALIAVALSVVTYRLVERPVRRSGLAGLVPRLDPRRAPAVALACVAVLLGAAAALPHVGRGGSAQEAGSGGGEVHYALAPYEPGFDQRVVLVGNSIPHSLFVHAPRSQFPDLHLSESASFGCTTFPGREYVGGIVQAVSSTCATFHANWFDGLAGQDTMLYFLPQNLLHDYDVDGTRLVTGTAAHDAFVRSALDGVAERSRQMKVAHPVLVTLSCHDLPSFSADSAAAAMNDVTKVEHLDAVATGWARHHGFGIVDQYGFLCPGDTYHGRINGVNLYTDALHFTDRSAPIVWNWLAPQIRRLTP